MKALILALIPVIGFACGVALGKWRRRLTPDEHTELQNLRRMREDLMGMAAEHSMLGDTFAPIAYDRMKEVRSNQ